MTFTSGGGSAAQHKRSSSTSRARSGMINDELQIRRRFLAPAGSFCQQWTKNCWPSDRLQDERVGRRRRPGEQQREFQQSIVKGGGIRGRLAGALAARWRQAALRRVLKAAANWRNKADGGRLAELNKLKEAGRRRRRELG